MSILKGILSESRQYYKHLSSDIKQRLLSLPKGSIKKRKFNKHTYYYLQYRQATKIVHKYLGKKKPISILKKLKERMLLEKELKKAQQSLSLLRKVKRKRKRDEPTRKKNP